MNKSAVLENKTQKILCDFNIKTDHPISVRRPDLVARNEHVSFWTSSFQQTTELK